MMNKSSGNNKSAVFQTLKKAVIVLFFIVLYAFGFAVTKVDLSETKSETRRVQLVRIVRALAHPDLVTYDTKEVDIAAYFKMPCENGSYTAPAVEDKTQPYLELSSVCVKGGDEITVTGHNFEPQSDILLNFIPPNNLKLRFGNTKADEKGNFIFVGKAPVKRDSDKPQKIQVTTSEYAGNMRISDTVKDTWGKIVETIFLALIATTVGCIIAIPLSFLAAKNIMARIQISFMCLVLTLIFIPVGFFIGWRISSVVYKFILSLKLASNLIYIITIILLATIYIVYQQRIKNENSSKYGEILLMVFIVLLPFILCTALTNIGTFLSGKLGRFGFLGTFIDDIGQILEIFLPLTFGLIGAFIASGWGGKLGKLILRKTSPNFSKGLLILFSITAYALISLIIMGIINTLYQFKNTNIYILYPALIGAAIGLILGILRKPDQQISIGNAVYIVTRSIFNILRSIESLVMVIVFVVWVGIGPFAGSLALALHTIAALGKMYSEQVENIQNGPLEAIQATGANLLQQIVYAVVPQIIPPYISFTLYRWDQNVRSSTIIGFAGGGGIGFLLQQNINLLNYRAASVQMLAIAIVVFLMDYLSSFIRSRIV